MVNILFKVKQIVGKRTKVQKVWIRNLKSWKQKKTQRDETSLIQTREWGWRRISQSDKPNRHR